MEIGVGDLLPEFLADALVLLGPLQTAGAITAGAFQTVLHHLYHFLVLVEPNCHNQHFPSLFYLV